MGSATQTWKLLTLHSQSMWKIGIALSKLEAVYLEYVEIDIEQKRFLPDETPKPQGWFPYTIAAGKERGVAIFTRQNEGATERFIERVYDSTFGLSLISVPGV